MLKILIQGVHPNSYHDGWYEIENITSSVTLIKTDGHNILVDTGSLAYREKLLEELEKEGLKPEDIDIIFSTHFHLDHIANNTVFKNAKQYDKHAIYDLKTGNVKMFIEKDLYKKHIPKGIEFFETDGHFKDHMSVAYKWEGKTYVVAGDVIREDIIRGEGFSNHALLPVLFKTMKIIFEKADVIIPGHGRIIEGKLFDELEHILLNDFSKKYELKS